MIERVGRWAFVMSVVISVAAYLLWTVVSDEPSARNAQLHPVQALDAISDQVGRAAPVTDWNVPWWSLIIWFTWLIGIHGTGALASRGLIGKASPNAATSWLVDFGVGFVLYAMVQLAAGMVGFARFPLIVPFFVTGCIALFRASIRDHILLFPKALLWNWQQIGRGSRVPLIAVVCLLGLMLVPALTPPLQSDGLRYHLGAVQEYIKAGKIVYIPLSAYSNMPFLVEMHYMGGLALKAPEVSHLVHLTLGGYASLAVYCLLRLLSPFIRNDGRFRLTYMLPALLYFCTPMSAVLATWPFTEHGITFFLLMSIIVLLQAAPLHETRTLCLAGVFAGGLIGTKYTMGPVAVAVMTIPLLSGTKHTLARTLKRSATGMLVMGLIGGTWYLKNLLFTGNPFYPLASQIFQGGEWTAVNDAFLQTRAGAKGYGKELSNLLLLPYQSTFHWIKFEAHHPGATVLISTFTVLAGLVSTGSTQIDRRRLIVTGITLLTLLIWFFSYQSNRLLLPTLALALSLSPIYLFYGHEFLHKLYKSALAVAALAGVAWAVQWSWLATALTPPPLPYLLGAQDQRTFRYQSITYGRAFDFVNQRVKNNEKVLLIGEHRIYGAEFDALWSDWFDLPVLAHLLRTKNISSTNGLLQHLRSENINWILINEAELAPQLERDFRPWFTLAEWQIFEELRDLNVADVQTYQIAPGVIIHRLRDANGS